MRIVLLKYSFIALNIFNECLAKPFPIGFCISETKIVSEISGKDRDFAYITPDDRHTYIYNEETYYYKDYQRSYFDGEDEHQKCV